MIIKFRDWLTVRESSPMTRLKWDAALGLKPPIAPASVNSKATGAPWQVEKLSKTPVAGAKKKHKKKKKKKTKKG
jgi:hypothetical protein